MFIQKYTFVYCFVENQNETLNYFEQTIYRLHLTLKLWSEKLIKELDVNSAQLQHHFVSPAAGLVTSWIIIFIREKKTIQWSSASWQKLECAPKPGHYHHYFIRVWCRHASTLYSNKWAESGHTKDAILNFTIRHLSTSKNYQKQVKSLKNGR